MPLLNFQLLKPLMQEKSKRLSGLTNLTIILLLLLPWMWTTEVKSQHISPKSRSKSNRKSKIDNPKSKI